MKASNMEMNEKKEENGTRKTEVKSVKDIKRREEKNRTAWNIRPYLAIGLTAFIVLSCCIVLFFLIARYDGASENINRVLTILQPILIGILFAYLLNPLVNKIQEGLILFAESKAKGNNTLKKLSRGMGVLTAMLILIMFLFLMVKILIPQLYETIEGLVISLPDQAQRTSVWIQDMLEQDEMLAKYADTILKEVTGYVENWLQSDLLPQSKEIITQVTGGIIVFAKGIINFFIGLIVCIYVLMEKDHFVGTFKKITYGLFPAKSSNTIVKTARKAHEIFIGFVVGKVIDSIIIGILCYIVLLIVHMPYALLVSVIVGVTNVIPFFGPYIGAIPSFLLILLENPIKALQFLIVILIIQQIDGNIIGPKILGDSTGLSSFWVMFAILLGGGLFGFWGMLFGVPTFAVGYYIFNEIVKYCLRKKNMPQHSEDFLDVDELDEDTRKLKYK
ncbi:MAG: AI-2E family transporter [Lachnospiraceae bacterium]